MAGLGYIGERELAIVIALTRYIRECVEKYRRKKDGWDMLLEELEELIELANSGLSVSLINKLYRLTSF